MFVSIEDEARLDNHSLVHRFQHFVPGFRPTHHAGHPLRAPDAPQAARLHARRGAHADARHRREHRDLQPPLPDAAAAAAVSERRPARVRLEHLSAAWGCDQASVSIPDYLDRKTQAPAIEDATLFTGAEPEPDEGGQPEQVRALAVTPSFFSTLGRSRSSAAASPKTKPSRTPTSSSILTYGAVDLALRRRSRRSSAATIRLNGESPTAWSACCRPTSSCPGATSRCCVPFAFTPQQMSDRAAATSSAR